MARDDIHVPITALSRGPFRNQFLSVSRVRLYEQCPFAFQCRYILKLPALGKSVPALFGNVCHWSLEDLFGWVTLEQFEGPFPKKRLLDAFTKHYTESGVGTLGEDAHTLFSEGQDILTKFSARHKDVDHRNVLATEQEFMLDIGHGRFVKGFIDRCDRTDADGNYAEDEVTVIDYKSSRLMYTTDQLETDIQATIYVAAARVLYPWAKKIHFGFDMIRHDVTQWVQRETKQLRTARDFMHVIGNESEKGDYPQRLNKYCGWCDYRDRCGTYQRALNDPKQLSDSIVPEVLTDISVERERVAHIAKLAYNRKLELEKMLKAEFSENGEVHVNDMVYKWTKVRNGVSYKTEDVIALLVEKEVGTDEEIRKKLLVIDNKKLTALLTKVGKEMDRKADAKMLKLEIGALGKERYTSKISARPDKEK